MASARRTAEIKRRLEEDRRERAEREALPAEKLKELRGQEEQAFRKRDIIRRAGGIKAPKTVVLEPGKPKEPTPAEVGEQFLRAQPTAQFEIRRKAMEAAGQASKAEFLSNHPDRIPEDDE